MAEYHFPVPGSIDEDKIVLFVRRHWVSFLGQFLLSFFMLIVPAVLFAAVYFTHPNFYQGIVRNFLVLGLSVYYLIAITVAFIAWISFYYDIYIICQDTIIDVVQEGFWGRKVSQLTLLRVQDVSSNTQGFLPTIFGYGDVLVETAGEQSQNFLLKAISSPQEVAAKIMGLHNAIVEKEGRHEEIAQAEGDLRPQSETSPPKTAYQELLTKEEPKDIEGEISHDDLDKGGEIELK